MTENRLWHEKVYAQEHQSCQISLPKEGSPRERLKFMLEIIFNWEFGTCLGHTGFPKDYRNEFLLRFNVELHLVLYIITGLQLSF